MIETGSNARGRDGYEKLTRMSRGTPMGTYMRCFWHPVATVADLTAKRVMRVKVLGERLALYRDAKGALGLIGERCPHRGASLAHGWIDGEGLRCPYHGWKFDETGACLDTPAEPAGSTLKERIRHVSYPVQELGGLLWAYLGPLPAPLLPRYEFLVSEEYDRDIEINLFPCNWLQIVENNMDPYHVEYLHGRYGNYVRNELGLNPINVMKHVKVKYEPFEFGIVKKRLWEGILETSQEWTVGHPFLYPGNNVVWFGKGWTQLELRVPVDDTHTIYFFYNCRRREPGKPPRKDVPSVVNPTPPTVDGPFRLDYISGQDMMVMSSQGEINDHSLENLGESDRGVILYRRTLLEQIEVAMRGEDPLGVIRDPAKNTPWIDLPIETEIDYRLDGVQYSEHTHMGSET